MQWDSSKNLGFSSGCADALYLPVDPAADAPTVAAQEKDPDSLLNTVRALLKLRHSCEDLQADAGFEVVCAEKGKPFIYRRGSLVLAVNPSGETLCADAPVSGMKPVYTIGEAGTEGGTLRLGPQSFVVLQ